MTFSWKFLSFEIVDIGTMVLADSSAFKSLLPPLQRSFQLLPVGVKDSYLHATCVSSW